MNIAVVGSREFKWNQVVELYVSREFELATVHDDWLEYQVNLVSGGARGVDTWAEETVKELNKRLKHPIGFKIFLPDWEKYGKRAGFLRNELIIKEADFVIAFWDGKSKGTKHSIDLALKMGKPMDIHVR